MRTLSRTQLPKGWQVKKLGSLAVKIGSGSTPRGGSAVYTPSGIPLIRSMNVHFAGIKPDGLVYIGEEDAEKLDHVTVLASISMSKLKALPVPIPPSVEQTRIVAEVERRLSVVEGLQKAVSASLQRAAGLRQSILDRAFAGKLVNQDSSDEPVEKMLGRVRAQHAYSVIVRTTSRKRTSMPKDKRVSIMKTLQDSKSALDLALAQQPSAVNAGDLFSAGHFDRDQVYAFYDAIVDSSAAISRLRPNP